ncbi:MAG: polyprenyl diphosphate synthase [Gammaproteobacteria bacterium]|nr:polyprenyl diphosphate synthase [Gammaproteobacteria bacterium]MDH5513831.1 polyprenyl diphosphate synthase [Gammaproteobacteria bacterium]
MKQSDSNTSSQPRHVAIIMDGNGRWARARMLPRAIGHREGVKSVRRTVETCIDKGIGALTLFAFSSENWRRPSDEVSKIMDLFVNTLKKEVAALDRNNVRLRFIGDRSAFSSNLQQLIRDSELQTAGNRQLELVIAANYGGQWDITQACRKLVDRVQAGELQAEEITQQSLAQEMCIADLPLPDLFIRTGGERRISNFLLWQLAYTELYFTDILWPVFDEVEFGKALDWFANRQRRFGRTGEQVEQLTGA